MKSKLFVSAAVAALAFSAPALADPPFDGPPGLNRGGGDAEANAAAISAAGASASTTVRNRNSNVGINSQEQGQLQGQLQGQVQGINSSIRSAGSGNSTSTNVNVEGDRYEAPDIPVASAVAPDVMHTAVCVIGASGGLQGMDFGISIGGGLTDEFCQKLEIVRYGLISNDADMQAAAEMLYMSLVEEFIDVDGSDAAPAATTVSVNRTALDQYCEQYAPASRGGQYASAPEGYFDRCG